MNLESFKEVVNIIDKNESNKLRQLYISSFINTEKEHYIKYVATTREFSDGVCYTGYLWDCMKNPIVVDDIYLQSKKFEIINKVNVMWDIHTKDRIFIKDYWKFEKHSVIEVEYSVLLDNLEHLPEDIYIFDGSFKWTLVLTHEFVNDRRWCLKSGNI